MTRARSLGIWLPLALLTACGTGRVSTISDSGSPGPSPTPTPWPTFAYVVAYSTGEARTVLQTYVVDDATGAWNLAGSAAEPIDSVAFDPQGRFLFAALRDPHACGHGTCGWVAKVAAYRIDPATGVLTRTGAGDLAQTLASKIATDPSSRLLYFIDRDHGYVHVFEIDASTGSIGREIFSDHQTAWGLDTSPVAVDPLGRFVYYSGGDGLVGYQVRVETGTLRPMGYVGTDGYPAVHPSGRYLYVAERDAAVVATYGIEGGSGSLLPRGEVSTLSRAGPLVVHPSGRLLYVVNESDILEYRLDVAGTPDGLGGAPTLIGVVASGATADPYRKLAMDPAGRFLYVAHRGVVGYAIDTATGGLRSLGTVSPETPSWMGLVTRSAP